VLNNLRDRIVIETDGQLKTGRDVVVATLLGAEEFGFATAPLVALGCIMMRVCHLDTCPVGVATQNPELRKNFTGDPEFVVNFMKFIAREMRELMAQLGFRTVDEMVGRSTCSRCALPSSTGRPRAWISPRSFTRWIPRKRQRHCKVKQDHGLEHALDSRVLLELCKPALETR